MLTRILPLLLDLACWNGGMLGCAGARFAVVLDLEWTRLAVLKIAVCCVAYLHAHTPRQYLKADVCVLCIYTCTYSSARASWLAVWCNPAKASRASADTGVCWVQYALEMLPMMSMHQFVAREVLKDPIAYANASAWYA